MDLINNASPNDKGKKLPLVPQIILDSPEKDRILHHWSKIPAIEDISDFSAFDLMTQSEVRSEIMDLMRIGYDQFDPITKRPIVRHAFSAKEILNLIRGKTKTRLKLSNVYFHLKLLQEKGFIEPIASIKKGKTATQYFGRKAKLFFALAESDKDKFLDNDKARKFLELLSEMAPDTSLEVHTDLLTQLRERRSEIHASIKDWISIEKNEEKLIRLNIDMRDLYGFLLFITSESQFPNETSVEIARILNLK